jgi:hypothetical protein
VVTSEEEAAVVTIANLAGKSPISGDHLIGERPREEQKRFAGGV